MDRAELRTTLSSSQNSCFRLPKLGGAWHKIRPFCPSRPRSGRNRSARCVLIVYRRDDGSSTRPARWLSARNVRGCPRSSYQRKHLRSALPLHLMGWSRRRLCYGQGFSSFAWNARPLTRGTQRPPCPDDAVRRADHTASFWLNLADGLLHLDRLRRNGGGSTFFPWAEAHSSRGKKLSPPPSSTALRPYGCVVDRLRLSDRHRGRGGRGLETAKE
jgi:hypothetical protein